MRLLKKTFDLHPMMGEAFAMNIMVRPITIRNNNNKRNLYTNSNNNNNKKIKQKTKSKLYT